MTGVYVSSSEEETRRVAGEFAASLRPGDVVALYGELGSGKTQFVKGMCAAFQVRTPVTSPTFVILHRYEGSTPDDTPVLLYHFDLYRVDSALEVSNLGFEEFSSGSGICIVEWAERLQELLPDRRYDVRLGFGKTESEREIAIEFIVPSAAGLLQGRSKA